MADTKDDLNKGAGPRTEEIVGKYCDWLARGPGNRVLDIGCGDGTPVRMLASRGIRAAGVDLRRWDWPDGPTYLLGSGYRLPFRDGSFDAAGSLTVLEHLDRPEAFLGEIARVVRSGGRVVVAAPNMYGSILLHPGDSVTHAGGFPRFAKNLGLHLRKQVECMTSSSSVGFDRLYPDMTKIPERATDYDAICATDPAVLRAVLRRFGVRVVYQSASLEYPTSRLTAAISDALDRLPLVRDLFGGIFMVGERCGISGYPGGPSPS